jgi:hypothetical protein
MKSFGALTAGLVRADGKVRDRVNGVLIRTKGTFSPVAGILGCCELLN